MSLLFFDTPKYAETHFKFKLPWSLLFRPWPEIFFDAPFQFIKGSEPVIFLVIKDANLFPVELKTAIIEIQQQNHKTKLEIPLNLKIEKSFAFIPIKLGNLSFGKYKVFPKISVQKGAKLKTFSRWNFPFLSPEPLEFQILEEELPKPSGYFAGEMHCHTHYSSDHVEFGATPKIFQETAKAIGLDFVCLTDHAYDFAFSENDYTKETEPVSRFECLRKEINNLEKYPLLVAGEEVSAGNSKGENVHMTVFAPENYIPGLGDCGRYWLKNSPTLSISKILETTKAPCFAAHPKAPMGVLEKFIFRRGYWESKDISHKSNKIKGIQFWNGSRDEGFFLGKKWWVEELGKGNFLLPIGGNDAHGDLNDCVSVKFPLISLRHNRFHIFGKVRTVIKADNLSCENLKQAFNHNSLYITDGPALWWEYKENNFHLFAKSNKELGLFKTIKIFARELLPNQKLANKEILLKESLVLAPFENDILVLNANYAYLRAEATTEFGFFALTAAVPLNNYA